jgi:hypothetical protein
LVELDLCEALTAISVQQRCDENDEKEADNNSQFQLLLRHLNEGCEDVEVISGKTVEDLWKKLERQQVEVEVSEFPQFGWFDDFHHLKVNSSCSLQRVFEFERFPTIQVVNKAPSVNVLMTVDQ